MSAFGTGNGRQVAIAAGADSGSSCPTECAVPYRELDSASIGGKPITVFVYKKPVLINGQKLSNSQGVTCTLPQNACTVERVVKCDGTVFHYKQPIAHIGDQLNIENNIRIVSVPNNVFSN